MISPYEQIQLTEPRGFADQTVRQVLHIAGGGERLRARLTNRYGRTPLTIAAVTAATPLSTVAGMDTRWAGYLSTFHAERPGVTEAVLSRCTDAGVNPYDWLMEAAPATGRVLDLACGSAPLWTRLSGRGYLGVDVSAAELAGAARRGAGPLARASATALPLRSASVDMVLCSMALMLPTPLPAALAQIARVLAPGGRLVATLPDMRPVRAADVPAVAGLVMALGRGLDYPNDAALHRLPSLLANANLRVVADERRRFAYRLAERGDADRFLASLYLPGLPRHRYRRTLAWLRALARVHATVPVPIRRVVAERR